MTCLRNLSETKAIRQDMIAKGSIELLHQALIYCQEPCFVLVAKCLRNLLEVVNNIPTAIFHVAVTVACDLIVEERANASESTML